MNKLIGILEKNKYLILLAVVEFLLFYTNNAPHTFLVGWDNVMPELNFSANLERSIYAVWQEYRGLGVIDGMAHASLLPHTLIAWIFQKIMPLNLIRYVITFLLHYLGGVGAFLLIKRMVFRGKADGDESAGFLSFLGAIFYLFNLITIQMFYTPLEVFSYHFAFLPLLLFAADLFLDKGSRRSFLVFIILSIFSLPQAHVPSIFLVYLGSLMTLLSFKVINSTDRLNTLKKSLLITVTIFLINAYWVLPYAYMTKNNAANIINSKINQMSTDSVVLRNKAFGDFVSVSLMRGFTLDYVDYQEDGNNDYMMKTWRDYHKKFPIISISAAFYLIMLTGAYSAISEKKKSLYPYLFLTLGSFIMLGNNIPILSLIPALIQKYIPLFYNVFRFTFTKFSIIYVLGYSIFLINGIRFLLRLIRDNPLSMLLPYIMTSFLIIYSAPVFAGNFFYKNIRVDIPESYFELTEFFKTQPKATRIATLPQPSFWGWVYYQWGVRGSGFVWYGLPQASLEGAFYPWSRQNENYFWEISEAVYNNDIGALNSVFDKYAVNFLIVDESLISPFSPKALQTNNLLKMIDLSRRLKLVALYGDIRVYRFLNSNRIDNFIAINQNLPNIGPVYNWNDADQAYSDLGTYYSGNETLDSYYPFRSLFSGRSQIELEFKIEETENSISFISDLPQNNKEGTLYIPPITREEILEIDPQDLGKTLEKYPAIYLDNLKISPETTLSGRLIPLKINQGKLVVEVPKIQGLYSLDSEKEQSLNDVRPRNCELLSRGVYLHQHLEDEGRYLRLTSINSNNCLDIRFSKAFQRLGYLITVENRHIQGLGLAFSVHNIPSQRADLETYFPAINQGKKEKFIKSNIILAPGRDFSFGYNFHFDNISIGDERTVNDLKRITANPIPYRFLKSIKINYSDMTGNVTSKYNERLKIEHNNPSSYLITDFQIDGSQSQTLQLTQSFDKGWQLYLSRCRNHSLICKTKNFLPFIFLKPLNNHVMVNNWANGWELDDISAEECLNKNCSFVIIYKPQYLEYVGFFLLLFMPLTLLYKPR